MMDKKIFIYIAIGFLAFSLWSAWQADYNKPTTSTNVTAATSTTATPIATSATTPITAATATTIAPTPKSRLVKVHTDVLDIAIDTQGGNLVTADLLKYPQKLNQPQPEQIFSDNSDNYYVAQSSILSAQGPDNANQSGIYTAEQQEYSLTPDQNELKVKLNWSNNKGLIVNKVFTFTKGKYAVAVDYEIINNTKQPFTGQYNLIIKRKNIAEKRGMFQFSTYAGAAISSAETPYEKISYSQMDKADLNREIQGGWLAMQQHYFLSAWIPNQSKTYHYFSNVADQIYTVGLSDKTITVPVKQKATIGAKLYVGPEIAENLQPLAKDLDRTIDYGWLWLISIAIFWIMKKIYFVVGNWGWSIILVTVLIKLVFYKLSETSCCSMAKMRELAPKIQALKERFGDDRQRLSQATMELYRKEKINPLSGCLPMLIQIPFFIALYYVLGGAVELRQAPFMFWIHDLAVKDPYYILPILMGLSMFLQQKLTPSTPDPSQAKMMMLMPVIFTVFFLSFPSGLVLYWLVNSCLSILQQWYINKKVCKLKVRKK